MEVDTNDIPTAERDPLWHYMEEGESFAEKQWAKVKPGDIPVIKTASLALLAFGIRSYKELLFGSAGLALYYWTVEPSLDGAILALSGEQFAKGQWQTASFPSLLESYQTYQDFNRGELLTRKQLVKLFIYVVGFYLGRNNFV
jgi:hypothetical protein